MADDYFGEATQGLADALKAGEVRVYSDPAAVIDPPAAVIGPPELEWETYCGTPTSARYRVYAVVTADDRSITRLARLLPQVVTAINALDWADVARAEPSLWAAAGQEFPAYLITVEVAL